jgi:hypothetical protein
LETDRGAHQPEKWVEGVGSMAAQEEAEQQLSDETVGLESIVEWKLNATRGDKDNMGDQVDLPTDKKEELQQIRLHKKIQPLEQLDRVEEEIRKLMLRLAEAVNKGELKKRDPSIAARKKKKRKKK